MKHFSEFLYRYYTFRWFLIEWTVLQKWLYVALYVIVFNISLIPLLVLTENAGLLVEGSSRSLGVLVFRLLVWFAIYQPAVNILADTARHRHQANDDL